MNAQDELSYGDSQEVSLELRRDTYAGLLNLAFTRGFISSQAFIDRYGASAIPKLLPQERRERADVHAFVQERAGERDGAGVDGFEAREAMLDVLDKAIADTAAQVRVVAYDLNDRKSCRGW
jgi:hypothetical protein